jgi:hypothetical protein
MSLCSCGLLTCYRPSKSQVRAAAPMRDFLLQLQADLPCPVSDAKIFRFAADPNHPYNSRHPVLRRGALAIVTNVGTGCGGRGSVGAKDVRRAVFRERARRADERRLNAFARSLAGGTGWLNDLAEEAAYGKTVWSWRPLLASSRRRFAKLNRAMRAVNSPATEARRIRLRGERGISRKAIARGMPGCSGCTCMLVCAFLSASCTRDRGC